jgi:hypothetical protein
MKIREEAIVYGSSCQLLRHDVLGLILEKHHGKLLPLGESAFGKRNRNNVIPSDQANPNPTLCAGVWAPPTNHFG